MKIQEKIPLKDKIWFQTGGQSKFFAQPKTDKEFKEAIEFAKSKNLELEILGEGANVLINDNGFDGLIINPKLKTLRYASTSQSSVSALRVIGKKTKPFHPECPSKLLGEDEYIEGLSEQYKVTAGAGITIQELIDFCLDNNLVDLEEFSGIPGTVGGSVYINIHYFNFFLSDFLVAAKVINKNTYKIKTVPKSWFGFGYDKSKLLNKEHFLLSATFQLKKASDIETAYAKGRRDEIIRQRNSRYPTSHTCGSFFRNFHEHELKNVKNAKPLKFVAYYLDKLGIKGYLSCGDAIVSYKHTNMIVNQGNATSNDIINLAKKIQKMCHKEFNITPQPECQLIGF